MGDSIDIRPAQPGDAEMASVLLYSAYTHRQLNYPLRADDSSEWISGLKRYFSQGGNRFSYQNIWVATHDSAVVGLVLSFSGRDEPHLNAVVGSWLEREAADDEWCVDALAVLVDWERRGIGTLLMNTAEQQARQRHYLKMALSVAPDNAPALKLYSHLGFEVTQKIALYERPYLRMEKYLGTTDIAEA
jgi:ribosomal protein S18 acetylase RimI-like enzyme